MALKLLKFEASWCGPCQQQAELLEDFDAAPIEAIDVDEDHETANEYSVRSIPTLILLEDGEPVERWDGLTQPDELSTRIEEVK